MKFLNVYAFLCTDTTNYCYFYMTSTTYLITVL